jgi:hypothetical protein
LAALNLSGSRTKTTSVCEADIDAGSRLIGKKKAKQAAHRSITAVGCSTDSRLEKQEGGLSATTEALGPRSRKRPANHHLTEHILHAKGHQRKAVVTNGPISFTEAVTGVSASSLTATDGTVASVSPVDSSHHHRGQSEPRLASGAVALSLVAGGATDAAGNVAVAAGAAAAVTVNVAGPAAVRRAVWNGLNPSSPGIRRKP